MQDAAESYFGNPRREVAALIPEGVRAVLEIGCGTGMFRSNFGDVDEYVGIEPTPAMAAEAAKKLDQVHTATYEQVTSRLPLNHFDLVVCNDVIEHMPDHDWFLDDIRKHIKPTGALLGSIPNVRFFRNMSDLLFKKTWKYEDWGILDRTHLRFFTELSWKQTLLDHNYGLETMTGLPEAYPATGRRKGWPRQLRSDCSGPIPNSSSLPFSRASENARRDPLHRRRRPDRTHRSALSSSRA
jgi:SAM-dependent methyltransferase